MNRCRRTVPGQRILPGLALLLSLLLSCPVSADGDTGPAPDPARPLLGRWHGVEKPYVIDFHGDGTALVYTMSVSQDASAEPRSSQGRWSLSAQGELAITGITRQGTTRTVLSQVVFEDADTLCIRSEETGSVEKLYRFQQPLPKDDDEWGE